MGLLAAVMLRNKHDLTNLVCLHSTG